MRKQKLTERQIADAFLDFSQGVPVEETCQRLGISDSTFYRLKKKYSGLDEVGFKRLSELEREKSKLRRLIRNYSEDRDILEGLLQHVLLPNSSSSSSKQQMELDNSIGPT